MGIDIIAFHKSTFSYLLTYLSNGWLLATQKHSLWVESSFVAQNQLLGFAAREESRD